MALRIGILSFSRYFNYGTQLQLFALQRAIQDLGYDPWVIDYSRVPSTRERHGFRDLPVHSGDQTSGGIMQRLLSLRTRVEEHWRYRMEMRRYRKFSLFQDERLRFEDTVSYESSMDLVRSPPPYDAFVVGSDQVWSPFLHVGDPAYFLTFAPRAQRVSYSPSMGAAEIAPGLERWFAEHVSAIPHLSVRESAAARLIERLTGRVPKVVADPTLLHTPETWTSFSSSVSEAQRPYVLQYVLQGDEYIREFALSVAKERDLRVVTIPIHPRDMKWRHKRVTRAWDVGPEEYLSLFANASYVCTDSFHGTIFATLFRCPFSVFRRYESGLETRVFGRISEFLNLTGLGEREARADSAPANMNADIDFDSAHGAIQRHRDHSLEFLRDSLETACS